MITSLSIVALSLLWLVVPAVFSIAFFLWWRRLRHWSFGLLSLACSLSVVAQLLGSLARNIPRFGQTAEDVANVHDIVALARAGLALHLLMGILSLIGALGFLSAARDDFLLDDAKKQSTHAA